jgi:antitoxin component of MazEF toxin-antitoxin module
MPIIRKILRVGNSKAVSIPKSWLEFYERDGGFVITEVAIEVDKVLTITPILPRKEP